MTRRSRADEPVGTTLYNVGNVSGTTLGEIYKKDVVTYGELISRLWELIRKEGLAVKQKPTAKKRKRAPT